MNAEKAKPKYDEFDDGEYDPNHIYEDRDINDKELLKGWDHEVEDEEISPWSEKEATEALKPKIKSTGKHKRVHSVKLNRERDRQYQSNPSQEFNISLNRVFSSRGRHENDEFKSLNDFANLGTNARYSDPLNDLFEKGLMSSHRDSRDTNAQNTPQSLRKSQTHRDFKSESTTANKIRSKRPSTSHPKNPENYINAVINFPPRVYSSQKESFAEKKARIINLVSDGPVKGEKLHLPINFTPKKPKKPSKNKPSMTEIYLRQKQYQDESMAHPQFALSDPMESFSLTQNSKLIPKLYQNSEKKVFYDSRHEISNGNISADKFGRTRKVVMNPRLVLEPYDLSPQKHYVSALSNREKSNQHVGRYNSRMILKDRSITIDDTREEKSINESKKNLKENEPTHAFGFVTKLLSTLKMRPESTSSKSHRALTSGKGEKSPVNHTFVKKNTPTPLKPQRLVSAQRPSTSTNPVTRSKSPIISSYRARKIKETGIGLQAALLQGRHTKVISFE